MRDFHYSQYCNHKLLSAFPEILENLEYKKIIDNAIKDSQKLSAHGIYEDVFCPFVLDLIQKPDKESRQKLKKALNLIEEIANHEDFNINNVAYVSFIERFTSDIKPMKNVEKYLGPKSLKMAREIARERYGRNPNTWEPE